MQEVRGMNDVFIAFLFFGLLVVFIVGFMYLYNGITSIQMFTMELTSLVTRTFREYYKGEDMEPVVINNGIDIVWKNGNSKFFNEDSEQGFITIMIDGGVNGVNSPIQDVKEADILAGKIIKMINDFLGDKEDLQ